MTRKSGKHLHATYGAVNSSFDLIRSHQQCTPWSPSLEIEPTTTVCRSRNSTTGPLHIYIYIYREGEELSWCPSWSNSLWQGWSCRLVHCSGGNATYPIWRVLVSSLGISSWTPLKPQYSNPTLWKINSGVLTSLLLSHLSSSLTDSVPSLNLLCHSKTDVRFMQDGRKAVWSIPYVSMAAFFPSLKQNFMAYRSF